MTIPAQLPSVGYIRQSELLQFIPFSKATLWRKCANSEFPRPIKLSQRVTAWRVEDVRAWIASPTYSAGVSQ